MPLASRLAVPLHRLTLTVAALVPLLAAAAPTGADEQPAPPAGPASAAAADASGAAEPPQSPGTVPQLPPRFRPPGPHRGRLVLPAGLKLPESAPDTGPEDAPVTIVEFSNYQCPYCTRMETRLASLVKEHPGKIRRLYLAYPLPNQVQAWRAAEAVLCADDQGRYWHMHDRLVLQNWALEEYDITNAAHEGGVDRAAWDACLATRAKAPVVTEHRKVGDALRIPGAPTFFVNGKRFSGDVPYEALKAAVDEVLRAEAGAAPASR